MEDQSIECELKIEDDYRKSNDNQKQRYFYPLNQETNFKMNKFIRTITKDKIHSLKTINIKIGFFIKWKKISILFIITRFSIIVLNF